MMDGEPQALGQEGIEGPSEQKRGEPMSMLDRIQGLIDRMTERAFDHEQPRQRDGHER